MPFYICMARFDPVFPWETGVAEMGVPAPNILRAVETVITVLGRHVTMIMCEVENK